MNILILSSNLLVFLILYFILYKFSFKFNLFDTFSKRKSHEGTIPLIGGILIYLTSLITLFIFYNNFKIDNLLILIFIVSFIFVILGIIDDIGSISPYKRLLIQIIAIGLIINSGLSIKELSSDSLNFDLKIIGYIFTILCLLTIINAFNFIDGIDGFCSINFLITIISINIYLGNLFDNTLILIIIINVIIFIIFNLGFISSIKIFLGDNGSTFLGFFLGCYLIYLNQFNLIDSFFIPWLITIPFYDMCRVILFRIKNKINPTTPDRIHIHHILLNKFKNNILVLVFLSIISLSFTIFGYFISNFSSIFSLILFVILFFIYNYFLNNFIKSN
tara:strand:+ start:535 stop:1533 length:999 start_codon:yes stop_codon:yes gene_type:complete